MKVRPFVAAAFVAALALTAACAPESPPDPDAAWDRAQGVCFTDPRFADTPYDLRYLGPPDTPGNAEFFSSTDGTCSGDPLRSAEVILRAPDYDSAKQTCDEWQGRIYAGISRVSDWYPGFPVDAHFCAIPLADA